MVRNDLAKQVKPKIQKWCVLCKRAMTPSGRVQLKSNFVQSTIKKRGTSRHPAGMSFNYLQLRQRAATTKASAKPKNRNVARKSVRKPGTPKGQPRKQKQRKKPIKAESSPPTTKSASTRKIAVRNSHEVECPDSTCSQPKVANANNPPNGEQEKKEKKERAVSEESEVEVSIKQNDDTLNMQDDFKKESEIQDLGGSINNLVMPTEGEPHCFNTDSETQFKYY